MDHDNFSQPRATGAATYTSKSGNAVKFYNDASENSIGTMGAYNDMVQAIQQAQHFIFVCDWSFHPGLRMTRTGHNDPTIGDLLIGRAAAGALVTIHTWGHNKFAADDINDAGLAHLTDMAKKGPSGAYVIGKTLLWRASRRTGVGYSHHQKFVVLDAPVDPENPYSNKLIKVFFGGLDLTAGRFDWPEHLLPDANENRGLFRPDDWYNGEFANSLEAPREPWHDIHAQLTGPAAWDFIYEFVGRWSRNPAGPAWTSGHYDEQAVGLVWEKFNWLRGQSNAKPKIFQDYEQPPIYSMEQVVKPEGQGGKPGEMMLKKTPQPGLWSAQVLRSILKDHWGAPPKAEGTGSAAPFQWKLKSEHEASIEQAYIDVIRLAEEYVYIESQYFIGSGDKWGRTSVGNRVPEALVNRILAKYQQKKSFHVYILLPMYPEGDPTSDGMIGVRTLQWKTIEWMIAELHRSMGNKWENYLSFYFLGQWPNRPQPYNPQQVKTRPARLAASGRYMIYVHSKLMIVDDKFLIIGSANLNERSLAGDRDTEICVLLSPASGMEEQAKRQVWEFRNQIWLEHLGEGWHKTVHEAFMQDDTRLYDAYMQPGSPQCIELVQKTASKNYFRFLGGLRDHLDGHMMLWPLMYSKGALDFSNIGFNDDRAAHIPDYPSDQEKLYRWIPSGVSMASTISNLAE